MNPNELRAGDHHYRAYVGPPERFDLMGALQFNLLTTAGLRSHHTVLDVGCGSLRAGRLLLPYLAPDNYFGLEPNRWLIEEAVEYDLGQQFIDLRRPTFLYNDKFDVAPFGRTFDYLLVQSIFSHTSESLMRHALTNLTDAMHDTTLMLATVVVGEQDYRGGGDWIYPKIVKFRRETIEAIFTDAGLATTWPEWTHPAQSWVLASKSELPSVDSAGQLAELDHVRGQLARLQQDPVVRVWQRIRATMGR